MASSIEALRGFLGAKTGLNGAARNAEAAQFYSADKDVEHFRDMSKFSDPMFTGFKLFFDFGDTGGLLADESKQNSAGAHLRRIGEANRADALKAWIERLKETSSLYPFLFQSIEGLDGVRSRLGAMHAPDAFLDIKALETADMRIASLVEGYRAIVWDEARWVHVIPVNLRRFSISIYLYPMGAYSVYSKALDGLLPVADAETRHLLHPSAYGNVLFELSGCEIDAQESGRSFIVGNNAGGGEAAANNIRLTYRFSATSGLFKAVFGSAPISAAGLSIAASPLQNSLSGRILKGALEGAVPLATRLDEINAQYGSMEKLKKIGAGILENAASDLGRSLARPLSRLFLGNIYEGSFDATRAAFNPARPFNLNLDL